MMMPMHRYAMWAAAIVVEPNVKHTNTILRNEPSKMKATYGLQFRITFDCDVAEIDDVD